MQLLNQKSFSKELGKLFVKALYDNNKDLFEKAMAIASCIDKTDINTISGIKEEAESLKLTKKQTQQYIDAIEKIFKRLDI